MVFAFLFAALLGAVATVTALSSYGWLVALLCAPFGGSALASLIALWGFLKTRREPLQAAGVSRQSVLAGVPEFSSVLPENLELPSSPSPKPQQQAA